MTMKKLWGGRFSKKSNITADQFSFSISYDHRLSKHDIEGSIAHAKMLGECRIIPKNDAKKIVDGLTRLRKQVVSGQFKYDQNAEDIHTNIQNALKKIIGNPADKLHTARSRNDQVALDMRLYLKDEIFEIRRQIQNLQGSILRFAIKNKQIIIPAYTHLQSAQVVLLAHHMLAYLEMTDRDNQRLSEAQTRVSMMPLGSCALSGTSLAINRDFVAKILRFQTVCKNSIDGVSARDFIIETISNISMLAMHLSRIAEDLILWSTTEFNFIDIDGSFCTGSSIMPHKKNPDILELIRGTTGKIYGDLVSVLTLMKGLPFSYNRDMQLDKPPLFESVDAAKAMLNIMAKIFNSLRIKKDVLEKATMNESFFTVDLMEYLIQKGVSYREAHDAVGKMVRDCLDNGKPLSGLSLPDLKKYSLKFSSDIKKLLNPLASIHAKKSTGSTNPYMVNKQLRKWERKLNAPLSL